MIVEIEFQHLDKIKILYQEEGWPQHKLDLEKLFAESSLKKCYLFDGKVVGFIRGHQDSYSTLISDLIVDKKYRNHGIAKLLLDELKAESRLELLCDDSLLLFYKKLGFMKVNGMIRK